MLAARSRGSQIAGALRQALGVSKAGLRHSLKDAAARWGNAGRVRRYLRSDGRRGGRAHGKPVLLLTTTGRRSGRAIVTPVV